MVTGDHAACADGVRIDERGRNVAAADVLGQGYSDAIRNGGSKRSLVHTVWKESHIQLLSGYCAGAQT